MAGMDRTPISDDLRAAVFENFKKRRHRNVLDFKIGSDPGEIIFYTTAGFVPCHITEDKNFIYFEMASGTEDRKTPINEFLKEIGFTPTA